MPDDWAELKELVLNEIRRLNDCIVQTTEEQVQLRIDVATLKVKAGLWGALMGFIPGLGAVIYVLLKK